MSGDYKNNHYVPIWYQNRFVVDPSSEYELYRLKLKPKKFTDSKGGVHTERPVRKMSFSQCFSQEDLYTTSFKGIDPRGIERLFFGQIDTLGRKAVDWCEKFSHPWDGTNLINELLLYMSTQKLRTPKGLDWLNKQIRKQGKVNKNGVLAKMIQLRQVYSALWMECVWLIADASKSETKFIVSDHPVTIYNRRCPPDSYKCRMYNDPDIALHASQTIFPLSLNKALILTNLSWVRNPYQNELGTRPNPNPFRSAVMKITDIQTLRFLSEQEVREINYIIKSRAYEYIAAAKEEWLYPERYISPSDWSHYGNGYLLMPDPRGVIYSSGIFFGNKNGGGSAFDEYGRRPGEKGYRMDRNGADEDWNTFHCFKGEFARLLGPYRRGRACGDVLRIDDERDSDEFHEYHLKLENQYKKK